MSIMQSVKTIVMRRQSGLCVGIMPDGEVCGTDLVLFKSIKALHIKLPGSKHPIQFDHIIPRQQGGPDDADNIQALCCRCHFDKTEIERPGWEAPSPSVFAQVLVSKGRKGINGPRAGARPSKTMSLRGKFPVMKCG